MIYLLCVVAGAVATYFVFKWAGVTINPVQKEREAELRRKIAELGEQEKALRAQEREIRSAIEFLKRTEQGEKRRAESAFEDEAARLRQQLSDLEFEIGMLVDQRENRQKELEGLLVELEAWKTTHSAAVLDADKRANEATNGLIQIERGPKEEVAALLGIVSRFANPTPLYKAIYDLYYRDAIKEMVARQQVAGVTGIYSITNVANGKIYIGQSVDIGARWAAHLRRGTGCDVGTLVGGKLYGAMLEEGIWNFRFDLVQVCERAQLNDLEKYYIGLWATDVVGYNSKRG